MRLVEWGGEMGSQWGGRQTAGGVVGGQQVGQWTDSRWGSGQTVGRVVDRQ